MVTVDVTFNATQTAHNNSNGDKMNTVNERTTCYFS